MVVGILSVAVIAISASAIFVKMLGDADPFVTSFWRVAGSALILSIGLRRISRRDMGLMIFAGACLGAHFAAWFASLQLTSVIHSTIFVCMSPVWVGLLEFALGWHRQPKRFWFGIAIALAAAVWFASNKGDAGGGQPVTLEGDLLALLGSLLAGIYMIVGKAVRQRTGAASFGAYTCWFAALTLLPLVLVRDAGIVDLTSEQWFWVAALAVGPQLLGHNGFNYVIRFLPASIVTASILLEPVGAAILGAIFLSEIPSIWEWLASAVIIAGVLLATMKRKSPVAAGLSPAVVASLQSVRVAPVANEAREPGAHSG
jgi:drug/metabolite transporter (DMT)-like permease